MLNKRATWARREKNLDQSDGTRAESNLCEAMTSDYCILSMNLIMDQVNSPRHGASNKTNIIFYRSTDDTNPWLIRVSYRMLARACIYTLTRTLSPSTHETRNFIINPQCKYYDINKLCYEKTAPGMQEHVYNAHNPHA